MYGFDIGGSFGKACLRPDDTYPLRTFETFGKIWVFAGICIAVNVVGVVLSGSLYVWLKLEEGESTLIATKVGIFLAVLNLDNYAFIPFGE